MRVAIDARKLHDFGIGTYIRNLLRHLARIDRESEYILLCHEPDMGVAGSLGDNFRTVLEASKRDILHFFNVPPEKISVVYNAIDERFWVEPPADEVARVRERFQL